MSVTGEALKKELAQRWFAAQPAIKLVNAYGLTETSDDTNHEVMDRVPDARPGPARAGRSTTCTSTSSTSTCRRCRSAPPARSSSPGSASAAATSTTPSAPGRPSWPTRTAQGERLYRGGDYGRWLPGGQAGVPRPPGHPGQDPRLPDRDRRDRERPAAGARRPRRRRGGRRAGRPEQAPGGLLLRPAAARGRRPAGPAGRVAARVHGPVGLPLAGEPAADRQRQDRPEDADARSPAELGAVEDDYDAPSTPTEQRLAAAWAKVLGVPQDQIGRQDHFFDRGGTSLSAVKLAIALDRAVSLKDLTRHPVLADLAGLVDGTVRAPLRAAPVTVGTGRCAGRRPGVLPLRRRQRGELPADGQGAAGQRAGGLRRRAARPRPGRRDASRSRRWRRWSSRSSTRSAGAA